MSSDGCVEVARVSNLISNLLICGGTLLGMCERAKRQGDVKGNGMALEQLIRGGFQGEVRSREMWRMMESEVMSGTRADGMVSLSKDASWN